MTQRKVLKASSTGTAPQSHNSLAQQIWGIDWNAHFPQIICDTIQVERMAFAEAAPIIQKLFPSVYLSDRQTEKPRFGSHSPRTFKARYYEVAGDFFVFRDTENNDEVAGLAICSLLDDSAYNFRNIAIAPAYQKHGIYLGFFNVLCEVLRSYGVSRLEGDISPTNKRHLGVTNNMGYVTTAMSISADFGVLLHVVKFLDDKDEEIFGELYSATHLSDLEANQRRKKASGAA